MNFLKNKGNIQTMTISSFLSLVSLRNHNCLGIFTIHHLLLTSNACQVSGPAPGSDLYAPLFCLSQKHLPIWANDCFFLLVFQFLYCCSITVVCIFSPPIPPTPAKPTSLPCFFPLLISTQDGLKKWEWGCIACRLKGGRGMIMKHRNSNPKKISVLDGDLFF